MLHPSVRAIKNEDSNVMGLFAIAEIAVDEIIWKLDDIEHRYSLLQILSLPSAALQLFVEFGFQVGEDLFANPSDESKYMNHSCDPNCRWDSRNRLQIKSIKNISQGDEITYDYSQKETDLPFAFNCHCESKNCRGLITNPQTYAIIMDIIK